MPRFAALGSPLPAPVHAKSGVVPSLPATSQTGGHLPRARALSAGRLRLVTATATSANARSMARVLDELERRRRRAQIAARRALDESCGRER